MCPNPDYNSCENYVADLRWMEGSGNVCWGMGAGNYVPCVNCRGLRIYHVAEYDFEADE